MSLIPTAARNSPFPVLRSLELDRLCHSLRLRLVPEGGRRRARRSLPEGPWIPPANHTLPAWHQLVGLRSLPTQRIRS
jgi:hypothetical protein